MEGAEEAEEAALAWKLEVARSKRGSYLHVKDVDCALFVKKVGLQHVALVPIPPADEEVETAFCFPIARWLFCGSLSLELSICGGPRCCEGTKRGCDGACVCNRVLTTSNGVTVSVKGENVSMEKGEVSAQHLLTQERGGDGA